MPGYQKLKFAKIYASLPPEAQQDIVESHLMNLLDAVPHHQAKKIMTAARNLRSRHAKMPVLDLVEKQKEVNLLLDELTRDGKVAFIKERSNREEIFEEIVNSLTNWLNDIWSCVYEFNAQYTKAHYCLLFVAESLASFHTHIGLAGCKCPLANFPVVIPIKRRRGKHIKTFNITGTEKIDQVLLWIWRDLFVSLFAKGSEKLKEKIPDMLEDIEGLLGWEALERMLSGGKSALSDDNDEDYHDVDENIFLDDEDEDEDEDEDDEDDIHSDESTSRCPCHFHAPHWSDLMNEQRFPLRSAVERRLSEVFQVSPSSQLFASLVSLSSDPELREDVLHSRLVEIAGNTPETLVAALNIFEMDGDADQISILLEEHSHLLRPRDAQAYQHAVLTLMDTCYTPQVLRILETELTDCVYAIRAALRTTFGRMDDSVHRQEFSDILKLRSGTQARRDRLSRWVDAITSSPVSPINPVAFAAMMIGFPIAPGLEDNEDVSFLDMDSSDADLDDLREEFRPKLKSRFTGWSGPVAGSVKGSGPVLSRVYAKVVEIMPFMVANDAVEEMMNRLGDRPSKVHMTDGLEALSAFCKFHRKKLSVRAEKKRRADAQAAALALAQSQAQSQAQAQTQAQTQSQAPKPAEAPQPISPGTPFSFAFSSPAGSSGSANMQFSSSFGGIDAVD